MRTLLLLSLVACGAPPEPPPAPAAAAEPAPAPAPTLDLEAAFPDGVKQIVHRPDELTWGPCPPGPLSGLGCQMAVLEGSPREPQIFTLRIKTDEPFVLPPHTHPRNERVTLLEGKVHVGFGDVVDKEASTEFAPGDYYVNRAETAHFVWSDDPMVLQITGIGPWKVDPVHPHEE
ncbi:MAG: hypothetical protein EP330_00095 [Deltaproteobacteria bacterium]|nr:MAG: hypothetical protein EP330_00095 [Deltaproteobacteria bacterium]